MSYLKAHPVGVWSYPRRTLATTSRGHQKGRLGGRPDRLAGYRDLVALYQLAAAFEHEAIVEAAGAADQEHRGGADRDDQGKARYQPRRGGGSTLAYIIGSAHAVAPSTNGLLMQEMRTSDEPLSVTLSRPGAYRGQPADNPTSQGSYDVRPFCPRARRDPAL